MKRTSHISVLIIIILILSSLVPFASADTSFELTNEEKAWLEEHPVIYYAPDPGFAPIEYFDYNGNAQGIAPEYLTWIQNNYNIKFKIIQLKNWTEILEKAESKEIDMITGTKNPRRAEFLTFTSPYVDLANTILVREDFSGNLEEADLLTLKTGVMRDYAVQDYLEIKFPNIELIKYDSIEKALKQLSFGTIDALVVDIGQGSHYTSQLGITNLKSAGDVDFTYQLTFAVRDDYETLRGIMDKAIASMPDQKKNEIKTKWISYRMENILNNNLLLILLISLLFVIVIIGSFFLWNRLLRRQVAHQTEKLRQELNLRMSIQEELLEKNQQITTMNTELDMTQQELSNLINLVPYHISVKDKTGRYTLVNKSFLNFFGLKESDVIGQQDHDVFKNHSTEFLEAFREGQDEVYDQHKPVVINEIPMQDQNGHNHFMRFKKIPYFIWNSNEWGMLGVVIDITDLKNAEHKMEELNEKLEAKVERRAYLLNETNRELELSMYKLQMNQTKLEESNLLLEDSLRSLKETQNQLIESEKLAALGRLVAGVSHEINTPLGIGITAISYLEKECRDIDKALSSNKLTRSGMIEFLEGLQSTTKLVLTNLKNAAGLVNKFKQIAVDQSTEQLREFNLQEYLDGIIQSLSPQLKHTNYKVTLECPEDIVILSYPSIVTQVITNLVMNSLIHGFDGLDNGTMHLSVEPVEKNMLHIHYVDDGLGIANEHIEKIFEPFFTTKRGQGGIGLGLNIVYNLITRTLDGTIEVQSEENKGVHFHIKIPIRLKSEDDVFF